MPNALSLSLLYNILGPLVRGLEIMEQLLRKIWIRKKCLLSKPGTTVLLSGGYCWNKLVCQASVVNNEIFDLVELRFSHYLNSIMLAFSNKKNHWFAWANQSPHIEDDIILFRSSQQLPRLRLGPSKSSYSWHGALQGPSTCLMRCFRNYRDARTPSGVPR